MKASVTPVSLTLCSLLIVLGLSACSGTAPREDSYVEPQPRETESFAEVQTEQQAPVEQQSTIRVKQTRPRQYTVKKGDTLWDISSLFLKDPWYWPEIWNSNPQVENPHLIYPGDVLTLVYINGRPQILVNQAVPAGASANAAPGGLRQVKLSPSVRRNALEASIPSIPGDAIRQFITQPRVVSEEELEKAPYIIGSDDKHLILGEGNRIYVRGELDKERVRYTVFRPGKKLIDPDTEQLLGYEAVFAGEAHIDTYGDPAIGRLTKTQREVLIGDRLLPTDKSKISNLYFPKIPDRKIEGKVASLFDGIFGIAKFQIAVLNRGSRDGVEVGHILASFTKGDVVYDRYDQISSRDVQLPNERSGLIMIFRTFDEVSYGLVMESTNVIQVGDVVSTPK